MNQNRIRSSNNFCKASHDFLVSTKTEINSTDFRIHYANTIKNTLPENRTCRSAWKNQRKSHKSYCIQKRSN